MAKFSQRSLALLRQTEFRNDFYKLHDKVLVALASNAGLAELLPGAVARLAEEILTEHCNRQADLVDIIKSEISK